MLCDIFENFRDMRLEIYGLDPALFLSTSGLAWQAALKKTKISLQLLELLTIIDMLLMVEMVPEMEYLMLFINMQKLIANT